MYNVYIYVCVDNILNTYKLSVIKFPDFDIINVFNYPLEIFHLFFYTALQITNANLPKAS